MYFSLKTKSGISEIRNSNPKGDDEEMDIKLTEEKSTINEYNENVIVID